jgi:hypothetical protein
MAEWERAARTTYGRGFMDGLEEGLLQVLGRSTRSDGAYTGPMPAELTVWAERALARVQEHKALTPEGH